MTRVNELASVGWTRALGELPPVGLPPLEAMTEAMAFSRPFFGSSTVSRSSDFMPLLGGSQWAEFTYWCYGVLGDCWSPSVPSYRLLSDLYFIEEESRTTSTLRGYT